MMRSQQWIGEGVGQIKMQNIMDAVVWHLEVCMSVKPDFATMTALELRAYVLTHRDDDEALQAYLDKRHRENPNSRVYTPDENVAEAIAEYLKDQRQQAAS